MEPRRLLLGGLEEGHIERRGIAVKVLGIGRREGLRIFFEKLQRVGLVEPRQQTRP